MGKTWFSAGLLCHKQKYHPGLGTPGALRVVLTDTRPETVQASARGSNLAPRKGLAHRHKGQQIPPVDPEVPVSLARTPAVLAEERTEESEDTMDSPSAATCRKFVLWHGLLLTVSLVTFWSSPTSAQLAIVSTTAAEGADVLLRMRNKPPNVKALVWYKGEGANPNRYIVSFAMDKQLLGRGPEFSGRESVDGEGSMLIKKVTLKHSGYYTVVIHLQNRIKEIGFGRLRVYEPVIMANLVASNTTVTENKDAVVLTCYTKGLSIQWIFNGMNLRLTETMKLSWQNRTLTINPVRREDAGNYQCEASNPITFAYSVPLQLNDWKVTGSALKMQRLQELMKQDKLDHDDHRALHPKMTLKQATAQDIQLCNHSHHPIETLSPDPSVLVLVQVHLSAPSPFPLGETKPEEGMEMVTVKVDLEESIIVKRSVHGPTPLVTQFVLDPGHSAIESEALGLEVDKYQNFQTQDQDTAEASAGVMRPSSQDTCDPISLAIAISLLNFWSLPTTAQLAIVSTNVAEGKDVRLRLRNVPSDYIGIVWYRGDRVKSQQAIASLFINLRMYIIEAANSGRENIVYDGSLLIKKVTMKDAGVYTVVVNLPGSKKEIGFGRLNVYQPVRKPTLLVSNPIVTENKDAVVLTCDTNAASTQWLFNGMNLQLSERRKLSQDHRNLTIDPVQREDAGIYQCKVSNPISSAERPVKVPILLPRNGTITENENAVVLTCYTNADSIEWFFNSMNLRLSERRKLSEDHRSLTIDPIQREDVGYYQCKVSNPISSAESWPLELHLQHD
ncbi:carcinoembryonic antigen-related cell adhesion molecule 5-like [Artibeus jamaicensis]|uniref:carcinoembryonic antigen-related cell adhesion molecule 5-like n=1 Tax=Artibeus jamaicensis TaxID=9417 RepID=UPI00235AD677|nr:carcinoembryonic antigen-related cell adhesion molecule 5-like [Artibeus jamaicensis]